MTLDQVVAQAIEQYCRRKKKSREELADELGMSASYLYRIANPFDETQLPLRQVIPLYKVTKDERIVGHLAHAIGRLLVRTPKGTAPAAEMNEYQMAFADHMGTVLKALARPGMRMEAYGSCLRMMEATAALSKRFEKDQMELEIGGE